MSDYLPYEIQVEIMKRLPVKSLLQFRSVSKPWKSLIDSSDFIADYRGPVEHLLVRYSYNYEYIPDQYSSIADDDNFPQQKVSVTIPFLVNRLVLPTVIGNSHGLLCLYSCYLDACTAVLWNLSIRKAVAIDVPNVEYGKYGTILGFGVCGQTNDPKIVKMAYIYSWEDVESISCIPWQVEVFTLSTGAWKRPYSSNLPRKSLKFDCSLLGVAVDGAVYWLAIDRIVMGGELRSIYNLIISFDITREEFREIHLPDALAHHQPYRELSMSKLKESLVVLQRSVEANDRVFHVWIMEDGLPKSFTKIFTICTPGARILSVMEFRKSGEPIIDIIDEFGDPFEDYSSLVVYEPDSKRICNLGISETWPLYLYAYRYMETLVLLNQQDLTAYDL